MYFNSIEHSNLPTYLYLNIKINLKNRLLIKCIYILLNSIFIIDLLCISEVILLLAELHTLIIMFEMILLYYMNICISVPILLYDNEVAYVLTD